MISINYMMMFFPIRFILLFLCVLIVNVLGAEWYYQHLEWVPMGTKPLPWWDYCLGILVLITWWPQRMLWMWKFQGFIPDSPELPISVQMFRWYDQLVLVVIETLVLYYGWNLLLILVRKYNRPKNQRGQGASAKAGEKF